jgi:hypothetical protein
MLLNQCLFQLILYLVLKNVVLIHLYIVLDHLTDIGFPLE